MCTAMTLAPPVGAGEIGDAIDRAKEVAPIEQMLDWHKCAEAVNAVKPGLAAKKPHIMLLAGTMYEDGRCVKPDWEKAVALYMQAEEANEPKALERLAASYALPGRDNGMALWWAARGAGRALLPSACIPRADPVANPAAFNDALAQMPPDVFQSCVYVVGVTNAIAARLHHPRSSYYSVSGRYRMSFVPAEARISWTLPDVDLDMVRSPHRPLQELVAKGLADRRPIRDFLRDYLQGQSDRVLARYPRPPSGLASAYVYAGEFEFVALQPKRSMSDEPLPSLADQYKYGPRGPGIFGARIEPKTCGEPRWPEADLTAKHEGMVAIRVEVGVDGQVTASHLESSSGHEGLDNATRAAFIKCRFKPAMQDGKALPSWKVMIWNWSPAAWPFGPDVVQAEPDYSACEKPAHPGAAFLAGQDRNMILRLWIGADGRVRQSDVLQSSGLAELDRSAVGVLGKCRFTPAVVDGVPVESWSDLAYGWDSREPRRRH
jgi:TonB family protein